MLLSPDTLKQDRFKIFEEYGLKGDLRKRFDDIMIESEKATLGKRMEILQSKGWNPDLKAPDRPKTDKMLPGDAKEALAQYQADMKTYDDNLEILKKNVKQASKEA